MCRRPVREAGYSARGRPVGGPRKAVGRRPVSHPRRSAPTARTARALPLTLLLLTLRLLLPSLRSLLTLLLPLPPLLSLLRPTAALLRPATLLPRPGSRPGNRTVPAPRPRHLRHRTGTGPPARTRPGPRSRTRPLPLPSLFPRLTLLLPLLGSRARPPARGSGGSGPGLRSRRPSTSPRAYVGGLALGKTATAVASHVPPQLLALSPTPSPSPATFARPVLEPTVLERSGFALSPAASSLTSPSPRPATDEPSATPAP